MYELRRIEGEEILERYNEIKVEVDAALEYSDGEWTAAQIITNAVTNPTMFHVWELTVMGGTSVAIATTRINNYPEFQALHVMTLGGTAKGQWDEWADLLEDELVGTNITMMEYCGRRGFTKGLAKKGWKEQYVTMRKQVGEY